MAEKKLEDLTQEPEDMTQKEQSGELSSNSDCSSCDGLKNMLGKALFSEQKIKKSKKEAIVLTISAGVTYAVLVPVLSYILPVEDAKELAAVLILGTIAGLGTAEAVYSWKKVYDDIKCYNRYNKD